MAFGTSVIAAKQAVDSLLKAWAWPAGAPDVLWGQPTEAEDQTYDMVYQGDPETPEDEYTTLGHTRVDEVYRLVVVVDVYRYGDDERATEERAYSHLNEILTLVNQNQTLNGAVNRTTGWNFSPVNAPGGPQQWRTQLLVRIAVVGLVYP
jgi:hypothetical protein